MKLRYLLICLGLLAALVVAGCGGSDGDSDAGGGEDAEPIKVAVVPPLTGPLGLFGQDIQDAAKFAADNINAAGGVDGRQIELLIGETDGTPTTTMRNLERMINRDGAQFVTGIMTSSESAALQERLEALDAVYINVISRDDALTGETCSPLAFRVGASNEMMVNTAAAQIAASDITEWAIIAPDYSFGHDAAERLEKEITGSGGEVVATVFPPLGTTDFGSYISQIESSGAKGIVPVISGGDAIGFINQAEQFGLLDKVEAVQGVIAVQTPLLEALGPKVIGFQDTLDYYPEIDTPQNTQFVEDWQAANNGELPYFVGGNVFLAFQTIAEGVRLAGSTDPSSVADALSGATFETINGDVTLRAEDHQMLRDTFAGRVVKGDLVAGMDWEIVDTVPASESTPEPNPGCSL